MIVEAVLNLIKSLLVFVFTPLPNLPNFEFVSSIDTVFNVIFDNLSLLDVFVRPATLIAIVPCTLIFFNFQHIYSFVTFILKKIPVLNFK